MGLKSCVQFLFGSVGEPRPPSEGSGYASEVQTRLLADLELSLASLARQPDARLDVLAWCSAQEAPVKVGLRPAVICAAPTREDTVLYALRHRPVAVLRCGGAEQPPRDLSPRARSSLPSVRVHVMSMGAPLVRPVSEIK